MHLFSPTAHGSCSATALVWMWQPMSLTSSWGAGGMGKDLATSRPLTKEDALSPHFSPYFWSFRGDPRFVFCPGERLWVEPQASG